MKDVKFSIVIPNYNEDKYIRECLESVFSQTYNNYEVIVVDDGSTDNSLEIVKDFNVKIYHSNGLHAGGARNLGIDNASGDYIVFLDSDDYFNNDKVLSELNDLINDEDIVFLDYLLNINGECTEKKDLDEDMYERIARTSFLGAPTKCFKRSLLEGIRFPEKQRFEDIVFTLECMCKANSYTHYKKSFFTYRKVNNSNSSADLDVETMLALISEIMKLYKLCVKYPKYKESLLRRIKNDKISKRIDIINYLLDNNIDKIEVSKFYELLNE